MECRCLIIFNSEHYLQFSKNALQLQLFQILCEPMSESDGFLISFASSFRLFVYGQRGQEHSVLSILYHHCSDSFPKRYAMRATPLCVCVRVCVLLCVSMQERVCVHVCPCVSVHVYLLLCTYVCPSRRYSFVCTTSAEWYVDTLTICQVKSLYSISHVILG